MVRPTFKRNVKFLPGVTLFKPAGVRVIDLEEVVLGHDEIEAMRLKHLLHLSQEEAAAQMNVSQPTFHRLLAVASEKMTEAVVNGKALRIEGGNINIPESCLPSCGKGRKCTRGRRGRIRPTGTAPEHEQRAGRIAITSADGTMEGMVDERFGRAHHLIVYDMETGKFDVSETSRQTNLAQGAGIEMVRSMMDLGVASVITGHLGPNAFHALQAAGIDAYTALDITVASAIDRYREGTLNRFDAADVRGHW